MKVVGAAAIVVVTLAMLVALSSYVMLALLGVE